MTSTVDIDGLVAQVSAALDTTSIVEEVAEQILPSDIAEHIDGADIAANIDVDDVADHVTHQIDLGDLAREIDLEDLAENLSAEDIAYHVNESEVASHIEVEAETVAACLSDYQLRQALEGALDYSEFSDQIDYESLGEAVSTDALTTELTSGVAEKIGLHGVKDMLGGLDRQMDQMRDSDLVLHGRLERVETTLAQMRQHWLLRWFIPRMTGA